jgi:ABC-2 type transport system ATP-binding protein
MTPALEIIGLRKAYGACIALDGVDLTVEAGEILALLGPNGAGKTTLVSIVAGLRRADAGTVRIHGVDATARPREARRHLAIAPQDLGVTPTLTTRQNMRLFGDLAGLSSRETKQRLDEISDALHLGGVLDRPVRSLSSGEQRRVHTAMALMGQPTLLLLDEPTAGVDVQTRGEILGLVRDLAGRGLAVVYSTHYLHEVEELQASVVILNEGCVIAQGTVGDLIGEHAQSMVELVFEGPPPRLQLSARTAIVGNILRTFGEHPASLAATTLAALGPEADRLRSVEIIRPNLESAFLSLTGHRWSHA